jgi:hypothetical protein
MKALRHVGAESVGAVGYAKKTLETFKDLKSCLLSPNHMHAGHVVTSEG